ncbi:MAG: FtsK/SpoIIIE domain-containing protein, partial [Candidatus Methylacidiphilaceae bacterium]
MNPFSSQIVSDPRQIEPAVAGLNDGPLERLLSLFSALESGRRVERAQVLLSPEPGYGKSHLIGRLFQELEGRATRVYLLSFEAVDRCWERILDKIVRELDRPDPPSSGNGAGRRTQLDQLAARTIGQLAADYFELPLAVNDSLLPARWRGRTDALRTLLRNDPLSLWEGADAEAWSRWLSEPHIFPSLLDRLWGRQIDFSSVNNPYSWFKVLLAYLSHRNDPQRRLLCLDWLRAASIDPDEVEFLRIPPADIPSPEEPLESANERAKERILDLCRLAHFVRPFLFCFDQTEPFGENPERARRFGYVVAELVDRAPNQMLVITANRDPWTKKILPECDNAFRDRMAYKDPALHLEGLTQEQARVLLESRLEREEGDKERADRFRAEASRWLPEFFSGAKTHGVRLFLQEAEKRWESRPAQTLPQAYDRIAQRLRPEPPAVDADALHWLLRQGGRSLSAWGVEDPYTGRKKRLLLRWKKEGAAVGFGWETGVHWKKWESLAKEAKEEAQRPGGCTRLTFFRPFDARPIPDPKWKRADEIDQACRGPMRIVSFDPEHWISLAALYELHAKVLEGDLPFSREECLAFVWERLRPWAEELVAGDRGDPGKSPSAPEEIAITVRQLVERCFHKEPAPPPGRRELGSAFHQIVEEFTGWLLQESGGSREPEEYWTILRERFARKEIEERRRRGRGEEAGYLEAALREFWTNLDRIAASGGISSWKELFEGAEISLCGSFQDPEGRSIRVEGRLDTLRRHPKEGRQLVDYKLSQPSDSPRDLLQLSIYAELLRQRPGASPFSGLLEYYGPSLAARPVAEEELHALFLERVRPVLAELGKEGKSRMEAGREVDSESSDWGKRLEKFFACHGLAVRCTGAIRASQLLRFQLSCPPGVRIEKLLSLAPTLRVDLGLDSEPRISPGAGFVAVELANPEPFPIRWEDLCAKLPPSLELPLLVGQTVEGEVLARDLTDANCPHVLVAGTTGSGKSVLLKSFLATLCRALPSEKLEVVLIDPKILTFGRWAELPQLRGRGLLTEHDRALECLQQTADEMDRRYQQLKVEGFESLSQRMATGRRDIPYRVIFFDEFADWLLGARPVKERFEKLASRIAQKGRAAGIHLILATQRPERKIVAGLISANLPVHVCLRVSSAIESRMVLGEGGAEALLGKGDLLCNLGPGGALIRAQAPFLEAPPAFRPLPNETGNDG